MATVSVDWDRCIHSGMCTTIAEKVFAMGSDARLVVVTGQIDSSEDIDRVHDAVACCPVEAILIDD